jgi:hypothetical protein
LAAAQISPLGVYFDKLLFLFDIKTAVSTKKIFLPDTYNKDPYTMEFITTDTGYLISNGDIQFEVFVTINQTWYLSINGIELPFDNTQVAIDFINMCRKIK